MTTRGHQPQVSSEKELYEQFLKSDDTLRVYCQGGLIFQSGKERLQPLLDYIDTFSPRAHGVTVFDRVTGNAAALLLHVIHCARVCSPLGSEPAAKTLERHSISYQFDKTVPHISNEAGDDMCPMEKLSLDKQPEEFHFILRQMAHMTKRPHSKN